MPDLRSRVAFFICLAVVVLPGASRRTFSADSDATPKPLPRAHAHNDYLHPRPLLDALEHGFCSVEADVFLSEGQLLVGHSRDELRAGRTLDSLYLKPLSERIRAKAGRVHAEGAPFYLLIDIKSEAEPTYAAVHDLLSKHAALFSSVRNGRPTPGPVTVVISGNCPREAIAAQKHRYAGIDGRPADLERREPAHLMPWLSANWTSMFRWNGDGPMPDEERTKLHDYVQAAHRNGRLVRFWATPEKPTLWRELLGADVDLIGTDELANLQQFLLDSEGTR